MKKLLSIFSAIFLATATGMSTIACGEFLEYRKPGEGDENTDPGGNPNPVDPEPEKPKPIDEIIYQNDVGWLNTEHSQVLIEEKDEEGNSLTGPGIIDKIIALNPDLNWDQIWEEVYFNSYKDAKTGKIVHELKAKDDSTHYEPGSTIEIKWAGKRSIRIDSFFNYYFKYKKISLNLEFNKWQLNDQEYVSITKERIKELYLGIDINEIYIGSLSWINAITVRGDETAEALYEGYTEVGFILKTPEEPEIPEDKETEEQK